MADDSDNTVDLCDDCARRAGIAIEQGWLRSYAFARDWEGVHFDSGPIQGCDVCGEQHKAARRYPLKPLVVALLARNTT